MAKYLMNNEIKEHINHIYYLEERFDSAGNRLTPHIEKAYWINSTKDYDHISFEFHHVVPYTDWKLNTKNVQKLVEHQALILLPKIMHQHLENPIYRLSKADFERVYKINPDKILFDVNSKIERTCEVFFKHYEPNLSGDYPNNTLFSKSPVSFEDVDLSCFDEV